MDAPGVSPSQPREVLPGVWVFPGAEEVARAAARRFVDCAWQAIARHGQFNVALSGGSTPRELYRLLASSEFRGQIDWVKVHVFWGDERAVPPDHPDSNYGMARRELLLRVPIPLANIHRMEAENPDLGAAAHHYEAVLRKYLELDDLGFPVFHLLLLGMGAEGHTASLFPGSSLLRETTHWVSTPFVEKLNARRMTLTLPVLQAAQMILFLAVGAEKAPALRQTFFGPFDPPLPVQLVKPRRGQRIFLLDPAAASLLDSAAGAHPSPASASSPASSQSEGPKPASGT